MLVIGLTGGIGSGKSTIAQLFHQLEVPIIDTDVIARLLVEPGQAAFQEISSVFTDAIRNDDKLDRSKLREIIFNDSDKRLKLESILHPRIQTAVKEQLAKMNNSYVIIVIPLLVEKEKWPIINRVLVVDCDPQLQLTRSMKRDAATAQQIKNIMATQASRQQRLEIADDIIYNDHEDLKKQVKELDAKYRQLVQTTN